MASDTPLSLGVGGEQLWQVLQPHHAGVTWDDPPRQSEAVIVCATEDSTVFFLPAATAPGMDPVVLAAQEEDGSEAGLLIGGVYIAMDAGSFALGDLAPEAMSSTKAASAPRWSR